MRKSRSSGKSKISCAANSNRLAWHATWCGMSVLSSIRVAKSVDCFRFSVCPTAGDAVNISSCIGGRQSGARRAHVESMAKAWDVGARCCRPRTRRKFGRWPAQRCVNSASTGRLAAGRTESPGWCELLHATFVGPPNVRIGTISEHAFKLKAAPVATACSYFGRGAAKATSRLFFVRPVFWQPARSRRSNVSQRKFAVQLRLRRHALVQQAGIERPPAQFREIFLARFTMLRITSLGHLIGPVQHMPLAGHIGL